MMTIKQDLINQFNKSFNKIKNDSGRLKYLENQYETENFNFHRIFLHSGQIYNLSSSMVIDLIKYIKSSEIDNKSIIEEDLDFLQYLLQKKEEYTDKVKTHIDNNYGYIFVEDLFNYLEFLYLNKEKNNCSIDGKSYSKPILDSQYNHILDSFVGIIKIIRDFKIPFMSNKIKKVNSLCKELYQLESRQYSIRNFINATMMESYKPKKITDFTLEEKNFGTVYYCMNNPSYWQLMEKYRDLNHIYIANKKIAVKDDFDLAKKSEFLKTSHNDNVMHFDYAKGNRWFTEREIYQAYKIISPMYGDRSNTFCYKDKNYKIDDLLNIYGSIQNYIEYNREGLTDNFDTDKDVNLISTLGEKALLRHLGLEKSKIDLLELLSYDINGENKPDLICYKPLLRNGKIYYILPTWFSNITLERAIDKILSDENLVKINLEDQLDKGLFFEDTIESLFKNCNIEFFKTKRDKENDIPEIDGMFIMDDYLFIFEAKASIKPENIIEAYNYLNNTLTKAKEQLDKRVNMLSNDKKRTAIIEQKIRHKITGLKLFPFILVNHHFFNCYMDLLNEVGDDYYPIIDFSMLEDIITNKNVPYWEFNEEKGCYKRFELPLTSGQELEHYIKYQINGLVSCEQPTIQLLEDNIAFNIVKPLKTSK